MEQFICLLFFSALKKFYFFHFQDIIDISLRCTASWGAVKYKNAYG